MSDRHEPTEKEIRRACMSYRHDFGLLDDAEQKHVMFHAREWLRSWQREPIWNTRALAPSPWQDIATAPKDARLILARNATGDEWAGTYTVYWSEKRRLFMYAQDRCAPNLTHWMPLPAPPPADGGDT